MATTGRIVYHGDDETIKKDRREFSLTDEIMELINSGGGGGGGAINGVKVNGQVVNPDQAGYVGLTIPGVINNLNSTSTTDALSAKQGKVLYEYIQALQHVGHFLALWNTATGLPVTNPETSPYNYNTGDYYIVSNVAAAGGTNYKPNGSSYTINVASTTIESGEVQVNDLYFYDGYERRLLDNSGGGGSIAVDSSLSTTSTNPVQNAVITNRLNQMALDANTKTFWLTNLQDTTTGQAVRDWVDGGGNAIVYYSGMPYYMTAKSATRITLYSKFTGTQNSPSNQSTGFTEQLMWIDNNSNTITITNTAVGMGAPYLATNQDYATAYTPLYDGSPATKKYVDDKFAAVPTYSAGTGISITSNTINNTGVTSVNGSNGAVTVNDIKTGSTAPSNPTEGMLWYDTTNDVLKSYDGANWNIVGDDTTDINTKTFFFEDNTDTTTATEMIERFWGASEARNPIIYMDNDLYFFTNYNAPIPRGTATVSFGFICPRVEREIVGYSRTFLSQKMIIVSCSFDTDTYAVSNVSINDTQSHYLGYYLEANDSGAYVTPRTPTYNGDPTNKKYVDDKVGGAISSGTTAPSSPTEGQLRYDTTNDVLKSYDGTTWNAVGGGGGVSITDVTVATAYNTSAKIGTTTAGNYTPTAGDFIMVNFVNGCSAASPTLDIDGSGAKNIRTGIANANGSTLILGNTSNSNIKMLMYYDGTYYRTWSTSNNTYSGMTQSTASTGTSTTSSLISAKVLNDTIKEKAITLAADSPLDVTEIWAGTEAQYQNLATKGATTAYLCVEE